MIVRPLVFILAALALAGCTAVPQSAPAPRPEAGLPPPQAPPAPATGAFLAPTVIAAPGLEWVVRQDAPTLVRRFGTPRLDVAEGDMRKLQFSGEPCVLDVFLYPLRPGGEPVATHLEARRASDGAEVDLAACAQALRRR